MYPAERHTAILAAAREHPDGVAVQQLSAQLGVTPETVRRDLAALERRGLVRRRHGGAVPVTRAPFEPTLSQRAREDAAERRAVSRAVVDELPQEGVLLLDSGSMTLEIASALPRRSALVVVTNSLPIASVLGAHPSITVLALPGAVRAVTQAVVGAWTEQRLDELHADVAVLGANGVLPGRGAYTTLPDEAAVKERMLAAADRRLLAVTAPKFGTASLCRFATLDRFDRIVSDDRLDPATARQLRDDGVDLVLANPRASTPERNP
ncbi:DeoR/GlpR family DNA-binding transcription regulator [Herbiconiux sp. CPCC 205716]|uniref:Lactose phosphotransferase system repressor n=1 Tax=Herbiconiux gentiana TaxID=2970912 RepID=A0ABT2GBR2_9MICO|nr:DeoR/GlpR family DNA-binding transcription regulator [Herbiconiux gentiana]MCS5713622.1 DeoR/GlpR family DNA-binding transcription regulator [Herbiconiux gentiana]